MEINCHHLKTTGLLLKWKTWKQLPKVPKIKDFKRHCIHHTEVIMRCLSSHERLNFCHTWELTPPQGMVIHLGSLILFVLRSKHQGREITAFLIVLLELYYTRFSWTLIPLKLFDFLLINPSCLSEALACICSGNCYLSVPFPMNGFPELKGNMLLYFVFSSPIGVRHTVGDQKCLLDICKGTYQCSN